MTLISIPAIQLSALAIVLTLAACSADENDRPVNDQLEAIRVQPEVVLEIEDTGGDLFGSLGVMDVDSEGRIYVTDSQTMNIRVFDKDGTLIQLLGREGSGPGEFRRFNTITVDNSNTLWVYDPQLLRISSFEMGRDGLFELRSQLGLPASDWGFPGPVHKTGDGFVLHNIRFITEDSIQRIDVSLSYMNNEGTLLNEQIVSYTENEAVIPETGGDFIAAHAIPFSWRTYFRTGVSGEIYIGKSDSLRVERYDTEGRLTGVIKNLVNPQPVLPAELERESQDEIISGHVPDYHPAFIDLQVDNRDQFWFNISKVTEEGNRWVALDEDGTPVKYLELPYRFRVKKIRDGLLYGIQRFEDGRQKIVVYSTG